MIYLYARTSTEEQNLDSQSDALEKAYPDGIKMYEKASAKSLCRPVLKRMLDNLQEGDTIVVHRLDRLSRSLPDFVRLLEIFDNYKVNFISLVDNIDTSTAVGRLMIGVLASISQYFRELTVERVKEGIKSAQSRGVRFGNPHPEGKKTRFTDLDLKLMYELYKHKGKSISEIARSYRCARGTVLNLIKKYEKMLDENVKEVIYTQKAGDL